MNDRSPIEPSRSAESIDNRRTYSRANVYSAVAALLFNNRLYLALASEHEVAVALGSPSMQSAFEKGEYPLPDWERKSKENAGEHAILLRRGLGVSLLITVASVLVGLVLAFALGKVAVALPIAEAKVLSAVGTFLAAWATLFQLGGFVETFSGEQLHELIRPALFRLLFLPGLVLATLGQLW